MVKLMRDQSLMSNLKTCVGSFRRTGSQELQSGPTPCGKPDGQMTDLFGAAVVPASHSPQQEKAKDTRTSATYGRTGIGSSASAVLPSSSESKCPLLSVTDGMTSLQKIWRK